MTCAKSGTPPVATFTTATAAMTGAATVSLVCSTCGLLMTSVVFCMAMPATLVTAATPGICCRESPTSLKNVVTVSVMTRAESVRVEMTCCVGVCSVSVVFAGSSDDDPLADVLSVVGVVFVFSPPSPVVSGGVVSGSPPQFMVQGGSVGGVTGSQFVVQGGMTGGSSIGMIGGSSMGAPVVVRLKEVCVGGEKLPAGSAAWMVRR